MGEQQKRKTLELLTQYKHEALKVKAREDFLTFITHVYPGYIIGPHHRRLAKIVQDVAAGLEKRVTVSIPPRFGKSEMISYLAPAWYLGKFPERKIIMASHTADLAVNFGRRVRNLVDSPVYKEIFPNVELQADSKSASRWGTAQGGEYFATGVGGALAGRGAHLFICDDPHSEQDAKQGRPEVFAPAYEWYQSGPVQRLMPGGAIMIVMCMTGDTPVLMADGTEKRLDQVRVGDSVATYDSGRLSTSRILNHQKSGCDPCFKITMISGKILRANGKHPFLVDQHGELKWVQTKNLQLTHRIVRVKDSGANGKAKPVSTTDARNLSDAEGFAPRTTIRSVGLLDIGGFHTALRNVAAHVLRAVTELRSRILISCSKLKEAYARFVANPLPNRIPAPIGVTNCVLTIATAQVRYAGSCAMTVTSQSGIQRQHQQQKLWLDTCDFTTEQIKSVAPCGVEEVFDVEVERTGNFIANGFVSHNTRWSNADLIGKVVDHAARNDDSEQWNVIEFPAVIQDKEGKEASLWPEFWPLEDLLAKKAEMDPRYWAAQYLQNPTAEEGALIKREWWRVWEAEDPPLCEFIIMSLDAAQEANNRADYNSLTTWGVFYNDEEKMFQIILLNAIRLRLEFPELKKLVLEEYNEWKPDSLIVEKKSNGAALYQELRRTGMPISEFTPSKGQDKISRVNAVSDLFQSGIVWAPDRRWARELIEECAAFPSGEFDDQVDSMTLAMMRFRQGGYVRVDSDEKEEPRNPFNRVRRTRGYYQVLE